MPRHALAALCGIAGLALAQLAAAQQFKPKSIQFKGAPEYTDDELTAAAGLKKGVVIDYAEMNAHAKQLIDSGMFATLAFKFDGQDLIFQLTPSTEIYPIHLENLPLTPGKDLDARLHELVPLYQGKVPAQGGLADDLGVALGKLLDERGITATVTVAPAVALGANKAGIVDYSIASPPVSVGVSQVTGVSPQLLTAVQGVLGRAVKAPFDTDNSVGNLERAVELYYQDQGYAAAKVLATQTGNPVTSTDGIQVPFSLAVTEGRTYSIGSVILPQDAPVARADVDRILSSGSGTGPQGVRLRSLWGMVARAYKSKGYLDCKVSPHPEFNDAAGTVNYTVEIQTGPVYHLGFVKFDNVSDQMRSLLMRYWQMMPGDPFDESYVASFIVKAQQADPVLARSLSGVKTTFDAKADPQTHDVNVVIHLAR